MSKERKQEHIAHLAALATDNYKPICGDSLYTKHDLDFMFRQGYNQALKELEEENGIFIW